MVVSQPRRRPAAGESARRSGFDLGKFKRDTDRRSARVVWKIRHRSGTDLFWRWHEFDCRAYIEFGAASGGGFHRDDITMFAVQSNKLDYSVMVAPDVKTPQDLKGKIVTGTRTGASADTALRLYLQSHGLVPDKDVVFISVADSQQGRFNALVRSVVAGTVLPPPYSTVAKQQGFRELSDLRKTDIEYSGTSIAGIGSYIKAHPAALEGFLKGYIESLHFFRTQKEKTVAGIMKYMRISDRSRAEEGYDYYVDMMPVMPYASNAGIKAVLQFLATRNPKALNANPEEFYDHSFLKKIEESGFSKQFAARR
jgi:ABC-type nitrate/sulfonate/bicarbonate transport system substrate-binding protein